MNENVLRDYVVKSNYKEFEMAPVYNRIMAKAEGEN